MPKHAMDRREFVRTAAALSAGFGLSGCSTSRARMTPQFAPGERSDFRPPVRQLTRGPRYHWFGYYDKFQFDASGRYVLGMAVDFHHRTPKPDDVIEIGVVDLQRDDAWEPLGTSRAWGWQQGCMLQWVPGPGRRVIWNDREGDRFVAQLLDLDSGARRTLQAPIYTLSPDGRAALGLDFARLQQLRPGYGYAGLRDRFADELCPRGSGVYRLDLTSDAVDLVLPLAQLVESTTAMGPEMRTSKHYFNHLLFAPDGRRFIFLHRWRPGGGRGGFRTRMLTAAPDGSGVHVLDPSGHTSHFVWRDPEHVLAWTRHPSHGDAFYLFEDRTARVEVVGLGDMSKNGHCTYLPDTDWILNDTYPQGRERLQEVFLYHVPTRAKYVLGRFHSPKEFRGEWRCDTHPRSSRDGRTVVIDSPHVDAGRQMFAIDVRGIVGA